jgi:hypothetical protein
MIGPRQREVREHLAAPGKSSPAPVNIVAEKSTLATRL